MTVSGLARQDARARSGRFHEDRAGWIEDLDRARGHLGEDRHLGRSGGPTVRPEIYASWARCRALGLSPHAVAPVRAADADLDGPLARAVDPVVARRVAGLDQTGCALALTDSEGRLLRRWTLDRSLASRLDAAGVQPGFSVAEEHVGTTSAICLLTGSPIMVKGPEHFQVGFRDMTCAGAPVVHPVTRRVLGSLDLTCRFADTSPLALAWVVQLAQDVQDALLSGTSRRERLLLDAYLRHNRDARHPLVALDPSTIITNAAAARLLGGGHQAALWEHAAGVVHDGATAGSLQLDGGVTVDVVAHAVHAAGQVIGAVLTLKPVAARKLRPAAATHPAVLPGLVGRSRAWQELCRAAARVTPGHDRVLLVGERGTGRSGVAAALARGTSLMLDAGDTGTRGRWQADLAAGCRSADTVVLRHVDLLPADLADQTERTLAAAGRGVRVVATSGTRPWAADGSSGLLESFAVVLAVPPLRQRLDDLPLLLDALTVRESGERTVRWMPAAVQALRRVEWLHNVASLQALVRQLHGPRARGYVDVGDLPPELRGRASRRRLTALEKSEAETIMQALHEAHGNKFQAAGALGIARSTLYRKVRALGLDLSVLAF